MIKSFSSLLVLIAFVSFCVPAKPTLNNSSFLNPPKDSSKTMLFLYGAYVFRREGCFRCHGFNDSLDSKQKSLDGVGGRYSAGWHYRHLKEPLSMVFVSDMPSFPYLLTNNMDSTIIDNLYSRYKNMQAGTDTAAIQRQLKQEAGAIAKELKREGIDSNDLEKKEVIALIAYIQKIPASQQKMKADSIYMDAVQKAMKNKDAVWNTHQDLLLQSAASKHKDSIAIGKQIFKSHCTPCHGSDGGGTVGPNLTDPYWLHGSSNLNVLTTIKNGMPEKGMMAWKYELEPFDIAKLVAYIHSIKNTKPANAKASQGKLE